jgi:3-ketosteroid 9alpha-monooxygenase subunit B
MSEPCRLTVARVVEETADARSFELVVPPALADRFRYKSGQFLTFLVPVEGGLVRRCYSLCTAPGVDPRPIVTVKRVAGGRVSNWFNDHVLPGSELEVLPPAGRFVLRDPPRPLFFYAGGSGITPVLALIKSALREWSVPIALLYANRDRSSIIFVSALADLAQARPGRLSVTHHLDSERGWVTAEQVGAFARPHPAEAWHYVCGPAPFMDLIETTLLGLGVPPGQIFIERFSSDLPPELAEAFGAAEIATDAVPARLRIHLDGSTTDANCAAGETILAAARRAGLDPPAVCEQGNCASCLAKLVRGSARMRRNEVLNEAEIAEGLMLTCQAEPTSAEIEIEY